MMLGGYKYDVYRCLEDSVFCLSVKPVQLFCRPSYHFFLKRNIEIQFKTATKLSFKMSTTRSQRRNNFQQESAENVSEGLISPVLVGDKIQVDQDVSVPGPSIAKSPRIDNSNLENVRAS